MHRALLVTALTVASLFALGGTALAGGHVPVPTPPAPAQPIVVPPAFVPPTPAPVTDNTTAANFARLYVARNAGTLLGVNGRRVRVTADDAACLQSPVLATRFGCVFTLRALVIQQRNRYWVGARTASRRGHHPSPTPLRARQFGCLGFLRINGGPTVTPTAEVVNVECARIPRGDWEGPTPTPTT
jgi:hypothetical protein